MAKPEIEQQSSHKRQNRFLLLLLVGATLMSAAKDLVRLQDFTSGLVGLAASLHQTVTAAVTSPTDTSCPQALAENDNSAQPFHWNGRVAPDQLIEINASNGGIDARPAVGCDLGFIVREGSNSESAARIQVAARASEAAISALQTGEHSSRPHNADRGRNCLAKQSVTIGVRNNDNQVDYIVRVPSAIAFDGRAIRAMNDEVGVTWLRSDVLSSGGCAITVPRVDAHIVNDRLNVSTGYNILGREINAKLADANCTGAIEFKTARGIISLNLLKILRANIVAESLNGDTVPDVPRTLKGVIQRTLLAAPAVAEDTH